MRSLSLFILLLCAAVGCRTGRKPRAPSIGEVYAGPLSLGIRQDIAPRSTVVATVSHGDRLEVIERRRRFLRVRVANGIEGWTDERQLLRKEDMDALRNLAGRAKAMPSQGVASTYDTLNVHTEPSRSSPSFIQVREGEKVDVLARRASAQSSRPPKHLVLFPAPQKKATPKRKKEQQRVSPPPMPPAPKPPEDWERLSRTAAATGQEPPEDTKPLPMDEWSLIRTAAGRSGWVLTRRIFMAIPDEVAQYAEGRRITSYFALSEVRDGDEAKKSWLWTTVESGYHEYDFDSFRVFNWSLRRHRYETSYIERNRTGYLPVTVTPGGFSVCVEKKDGKRYWRKYVLAGNSVRSAGETPCGTAPPERLLEEAPKVAEPVTGTAANPSLSTRIKERIAEWRKRLLP
ncbi:MAG: hypothetical protein EXQ52_04220 [Bryobacterales bacterium]|nr:hypothetical protein [Bryobacterales bacterium]